MQNRILRSVALLSAVFGSAAWLSTVAHAQMTGSPLDPGQMLQHGAAMAPQSGKEPSAPPPALPGASSRTDAVAPATHIPTDMSPNDALFDAINRGDIAAARDAMSRGAELDAQNVLGMTPMELSVDLGRNDISFLLLSYRGGDASESAPPAQAGPAPAGPPVRRVAARGKAGTGGKVAAAKPARQTQEAIATGMPGGSRAPRLFANDGGSPVPGAGFLGFGGGPATR